MIKIALDAGHGLYTAGKRTPHDEREWTFNSKVLLACQNKLLTFKEVAILRLDDPTGKVDVPLKSRTDKANVWKADVLVSIHHNALKGVWGTHGGVETFVHPTGRRASYDLANIVQPLTTKAMGLPNRGVKQLNLHMVRESNMAAILTEGGFMDSLTDIKALRSDAKLKAQGEAIADGLAKYYKLVPKATTPPSLPKPVPVKEVVKVSNVLPKTQQDDIRTLLKKAFDNGVFSVDHTSTVATMTRERANDLLISYIARTK